MFILETYHGLLEDHEPKGHIFTQVWKAMEPKGLIFTQVWKAMDPKGRVFTRVWKAMFANPMLDSPMAATLEHANLVQLFIKML